MLLSGMQLDKLTGGKMIATNHRVNTLKVDAERLVVTHSMTGMVISRFFFSAIHSGTPGQQSLINPLIRSLNSRFPNLRSYTLPPTPRWRGSWRSKILSWGAVTPECYSSQLRPIKCTRKSTRRLGRWVLSKNTSYSADIANFIFFPHK